MEPSNNQYLIDKILKEYSGGENTISTKNNWKGFKEFILVDKIQECQDIISFYFKPKDQTKLPLHKPGQYLPIKIKTDDPTYKDELRTYSLSMIPNEVVYRISVKKIQGGLISTYLHDKLNIGDTIEAMEPLGLFTINNTNNKPVVLISGGIGITPLLSMVYDYSTKDNTKNDVYIIQAVQNSSIHPFKEGLELIGKNTNLKNIVFYSNPLEEDKLGEDYDVKGYISSDWIKENLPLDADFYFCGPPVFMKILNKSLLSLGVDRKHIHYEFFGEATEME